MATVRFPDKTLDFSVNHDWEDIEETILEVNSLNQQHHSSEEKQLQLFNARGKVIAFVSRGIPEKYLEKREQPKGSEDHIHLGLNARPVTHECQGIKHSFDFVNLNRKKTPVWECPFTRRKLQFKEICADHETQQGIYQLALDWLDAIKSENPDYKTSIIPLRYLDPQLQRPGMEQISFPPRDLWLMDIYRTLSDSSPRRHTLN